MSIQAVAWVLDQSRSRGFARLVLISLANHHNAGTGQCNPGQRLIAQEAGISPGSVSAQIAKLVTLGEVTVERPGGSHRSAVYRLNFAQEMSKAPFEYAREMSEEVEVRANLPASTRGILASTRGSGPRGTIEPSTEPTDELTLVADATEQPPRPRRAAKPFPEFDALVEVFGEPGTRQESAFYARTARDLAAQGKTADEIRDRGRRARSRHRDCTPGVLLNRWSGLAPPSARGRGGTWDDVAARDAALRAESPGVAS